MPETANVQAGQAVVVEIDARGADPNELLEAVDATLCTDLPRVQVRVLNANSSPVAAGLRADPRVELTGGMGSPNRDAVRISMPIQGRPAPHTFPVVVAALSKHGVGEIEVALPGRFARIDRFALATRLPLGKTLRATTAGASGRRRLSAQAVGLATERIRLPEPPPPKGKMAQERAEHLRHRARAATLRARVDRDQQRLSRERLQIRHERARARVAEERLAATGAGEWLRWRARQVGSVALMVPRGIGAAAQGVRSFAKRAIRFVRNRWRSRGEAD